MSNRQSLSGVVENLVYDFFCLAGDAVLQKRKAIVHPLVSNSPSNSPYTNSKIADGLDENCRHCRNVLSAWKRDLTKLLVLDLYLFNPDNNSYILIERWKICYQKTADNRDYKPFGFINRRVLTLIRTMYCFIRLLPAFHQLHYCPNLPTFGFQIYDPNQSYSNGQSIHNFKYDTTKYKFNPVSTSKGYLHVGVTFVTPNNVGTLLAAATRGKSVPIPLGNPGEMKKDDGVRLSVPVAAVSSPAEFHLKQRTHSDPEHDPHYGGTPPGRSNQMVTFSDKVGTRHMSMTEEKHLRRGDTRRLTANFSGQYDRYTMYGKSGTSPVNPSPYMQYSKSLDTPPSYLAHLFDNCPDSPSLDNYRNDQALTIAGSGKGIPNYLGPFVKDPYTAAPFTLPTSQEAAGSYPDSTGASPPYAQFSASLISTSPHIASSMNDYMSMYRRDKVNLTTPYPTHQDPNRVAPPQGTSQNTDIKSFEELYENIKANYSIPPPKYQVQVKQMNGTSSVEIAESGTNKGNEGKNSSNGEDQDDAEDSVSLNFRNEKNVDDPIEEQDIFGEMLFDQDLPFANPSSTMDGIAADVDSEGNYILANSNHLKLFNTNRNIIHENVTGLLEEIQSKISDYKELIGLK